MRHLFHRPAECLNNFEGIMAGLAAVVNKQYKRALKKVDRNVVREVSRFLFEAAAFPGRKLDLASLNIQRGRDHGLAPYIKYRTFCGLPPVKGFDDQEALGPYVRDLAKVYRSIADIDLFVGLLYEPVKGDASVGSTLTCLLGIQFFSLKFGDRFFFDTTDETLGFNDEQLLSLRNMTLAKVMCQNTNVQELQLDVFTLPSKQNPTYPCHQLRSESLDLTLFTQHD
ncbi:unnamed protein product [Lymnaea stagnalis]|uniref:Peroxidase n=1 Tax=Lymnaea stagnalis TaxID=6523 RepID=A0AAV2HGD5_LYMST